MMGVVAGHRRHHDLRRRRFLAQAADECAFSIRCSTWAPDRLQRRRRPPAADPARRRATRCRSSIATPVASAQIKSAVLLAGLNAPGTTTVIEAEATRDHTERMLRHFGASVRVEPHGAHGRHIELEGQPELRPDRSSCRPIPPPPPSRSSRPLIVPGSDIVIEGVMMNPLRIGLITTLREMGADITELDRRVEGGEDVADLRVRAFRAQGRRRAGRAGALDDRRISGAGRGRRLRRGHTRMNGLDELRVKESDRLAAVAAGLAANGVAYAIEGSDLLVEGRGGPCRAAASSSPIWTTASPWPS